jgi:predicted protein tyrosine phosphatase
MAEISCTGGFARSTTAANIIDLYVQPGIFRSQRVAKLRRLR